MTAKSLVDTNVLVYRFDPRFPAKQEIADRLLREGVRRGNLVLPHQALLEFVAAVIRPRADLDSRPLLDEREASLEVEGLIDQFPVIYPDEPQLRTALRGMALYRLSWFDAHLWACAETSGLGEILSEDFQHGRRYGIVRVRDPFLEAADQVHELPSLYAT